jgi:hypothetical protein
MMIVTWLDDWGFPGGVDINAMIRSPVASTAKFGKTPVSASVCDDQGRGSLAVNDSPAAL